MTRHTTGFITLHVMWIWGIKAYPFTSLREEQLWEEESWRIELLAAPFEAMIFDWINAGKFICLYGGDDIYWIRRFTYTAQAVACTAKIQLEMLYARVQIGKSVESDHIMQKIMMLLTFNCSEEGWSVISRGTGDVAFAKGSPDTVACAECGRAMEKCVMYRCCTD
ncbi:hypothetical protein POM88_002847 [Heracleum sosnowskyi]|uniref:Sieve element occlusion C-terminal domain-containing protein n=1 Tax=Heracleum sosnowskyi TaxID=360622 RepID=A0AAD8JIP8_9APIA|nr:hypothetical protein POM88_002847 [Heracleum sosnowskyi]